jgi:hypothetical protein
VVGALNPDVVGGLNPKRASVSFAQPPGQGWGTAPEPKSYAEYSRKLGGSYADTGGKPGKSYAGLAGGRVGARRSAVSASIGVRRLEPAPSSSVQSLHARPAKLIAKSSGALLARLRVGCCPPSKSTDRGSIPS